MFSRRVFAARYALVSSHGTVLPTLSAAAIRAFRLSSIRMVAVTMAGFQGSIALSDFESARVIFVASRTTPHETTRQPSQSDVPDSTNQGENLTISGGTDLAITPSCDRGRSPEGFPCSSARSAVPCQARPMSALVKSNLSVPNWRCQRLVAVAAHKVVRAKPAVAHPTAQPTCPRRSGIR